MAHVDEIIATLYWFLTALCKNIVYQYLLNVVILKKGIIIWLSHCYWHVLLFILFSSKWFSTNLVRFDAGNQIQSWPSENDLVPPLFALPSQFSEKAKFLCVRISIGFHSEKPRNIISYNMCMSWKIMKIVLLKENF